MSRIRDLKILLITLIPLFSMMYYVKKVDFQLRAQGKVFINFKLVDLNAHGAMVPCESNLKNIGTAMMLYSSDKGGRYPQNLGVLTPGYLKILPTCPAAGTMSYRYMYSKEQDIFTVWCQGAYHTPVYGVNKPVYGSLRGFHKK